MEQIIQKYKDTNNTNVNVKMTGKEYLALRKYEDSISRKATTDIMEFFNNHKYTATILTILIAILIWSYNLMTYTEPVSKGFTPEGVLIFMLICLGISWIIHGVGFVLIKR